MSAVLHGMRRGLIASVAASIAASVAVMGLAVGCGSPQMFRLSSDENNRAALGEALARRTLPATPTPINSSGQPRMFAVTSSQPRTLVAYDLAASKPLWQVQADVQSRICVGGDFVVAVEGTAMVARDQATGAPRWKAAIEGELVGMAADRERAYVVTRTGQRWALAAYAGATGTQLWRTEAAGQLGAPAAQGGLVFAPFLAQWLTILDGKTGASITRLRGIDEQITMLRVTSTAAYYGSKPVQGTFRLDERSAAGTRAEASYINVPIPPQLDRTSYGRDVYDPVQQAYTAYDRAHVLWSSEPTSSGPMKLTNDRYAIAYFRYVFGFATDGALTWAYSHPRVELVATEHTGRAILGVSASGDVVGLDPASGALLGTQSLGTTAPILGATFDADGWAPPGEGQKVETVAALVAIARDRDARFQKVKELAATTLAKLSGPEVTTELLAVLADDRQPQPLKDMVLKLLIDRRDPASLPILTAQLAQRTDYLARTEADTAGALAEAITGLRGTAVDPAHVAPALAALGYHLDAPATAVEDVVRMIEAMVAIGGGAERRVLSSHLLLYRVDEDRGADTAWQKAIVGALASTAGPGDRELLRFVAADPRTVPTLAALIRETVGED